MGVSRSRATAPPRGFEPSVFLTFTQDVETSWERTDEGRVTVTTTLLHASGESRSGTYSVPVLPVAKGSSSSFAQVKPTDFGAATTYARRHGLEALLGIAAGVEEEPSPVDAARRFAEDARHAKSKPAAKAKGKGGVEGMTGDELEAAVDRMKKTVASAKGATLASAKARLEQLEAEKARRFSHLAEQPAA
ncbi:MAG: ERF family protein [Deltaproteobacteria bacterium]|nr:ERF family protein [Deltaproteobacteria bacterium]